MQRTAPICLAVILFLSGCGGGSEPKVVSSKAEVVECWPRMKLEVDPEAPTVRWSRWFSKARVRLLVRSSANQPMRVSIGDADHQTVFYVDNLPKTRAGEEFVVEVWDDQSSTPEQQEAMATTIAAGTRLLARTLGDKTYAVSEHLIDAPEVDVLARAAASWKAADWKFLGKATAIVGNNGLSDLRHANAISITSSSNQREIIGKLTLHTEAAK
jgi:hypothetical protein